MTSSLKIYRICSFDAPHHILTADFIEASSDAEAIAKVEAMGFGTKCEIWDGDRLAVQLEAEQAA